MSEDMNTEAAATEAAPNDAPEAPIAEQTEAEARAETQRERDETNAAVKAERKLAEGAEDSAAKHYSARERGELRKYPSLADDLPLHRWHKCKSLDLEAAVVLGEGTLVRRAESNETPTFVPRVALCYLNKAKDLGIVGVTSLNLNV